ncbi:MAG: pilus assembly protein, partial [Candidatus Heimdallarchaeota archaeon]|nr:pilus assembly protein [Candidatus Heimdallarchaeota archaeon]
MIDKKIGLKTGNNNKESGQSLVELALVFTTIVFMLSILVDIGRAFFTLIALNDAAQGGAVHASM